MRQLHYVVFMSTSKPKQLELGIVNGIPLSEIPEDLFIPPHALEICLETFTGPMDLLLYLIKRLQEYQVFKTVSEELANMDRVNRDFYLASVGIPKVEKKTNIIDFNAAKLRSSMAEVLSRPKLDKSHQIAFEELSTQDRICLLYTSPSPRDRG